MKEKVKNVIFRIIEDVPVVLFVGLILWTIVYCTKDTSDDMEYKYTTSTSLEDEVTDLEDENRELELQIEDLQSEIYGLEEKLGNKEVN